MRAGIGLAAILIGYVFFCGAVLYFCVIADPATSDIAYTFTVVLPNKAWEISSKLLGRKKLGILEAILDRALLFVYLFVVLGTYTVVFWYIYPWMGESSHVSSHHKIAGYLLFVACLGSWRYCSRTSPGMITAKSFKRYDHYPYDNLLFLSDRKCNTTNIVKIARSKYDRLKYHQNVPRYDHFCGWVYNTIGEENYRWFLLFLAIHVVMCVYGSTVSILLFRGEIADKHLFELTFFDRNTGEEFKATWYVISQYFLVRRLPEVAVLAVMFVMGIALGGFLGYHVWLTSVNMTTNEAQKWSDVKSWYKKATKKYKEAVKNGEYKQEAKRQAKAPDLQDDGDVTCIPGASSSEPSKPQEEALIVDPGPIPENIYNRGFVENWNEVLFPLSLRKDYVVNSGKAKAK
jgi:palmitoyltransferase